MSRRNADKIKHDADIHVSIGKIKKNAQLTAKDTGWSEAEKKRMRELGYDSLDIVREWYS